MRAVPIRLGTRLSGYLLGWVCLIAWITWRCLPALTTPGVSYVDHLDGQGTLGIIQIVSDDVREKGWGQIPGDKYATRRIGAGLLSPMPMNPWWKLGYALLGQWLTADNVWDFIVFSGIVAMAAAWLLLMWELAFSAWIAFWSSVCWLSMDNILWRMSSHLGQAIAFMPIILAWAAVRAGRKPSPGRLVVLGLAAGFAVLQNEYLGFYGLTFGLLVFLGFYASEGKGSGTSGVRTILAVALGLLAFVGLLCISYPNLLGISGSSGTGTAKTLLTRRPRWEDFSFYTSGYGKFVTTNFEWLRHLGIRPLSKAKYWEFSYRIGILMPLFLFATLFFWRRATPAQSLWTRLKTPGGVLLFCGVITALWGMTPSSPLSLVPLAFKYFSTFRVGVRSYFFLALSLFVLLAFCFNFWWRKLLDSRSIVWARSGVAALAVLLVSDFATVPIWGRYPAEKQPDLSAYAPLASRPRGWLVELPFHYTSRPGNDVLYWHFYSQLGHHQNLVNPPYELTDQEPFLPQLKAFSAHLESLTPEKVAELADAGLDYLAVKADQIGSLNAIRGSGRYHELPGGNPALLLFERDPAFPVRFDFVEHFLQSMKNST